MPRPKKGEPNKSEFVRKNAALPVTEIIEKAKREGLSITAGLVYQVRGRSAAKAPAPARKGAPTSKVARKAATTPAAKKAAPAAQAQFIEANAELAPHELEAKARQHGVDIVVVSDQKAAAAPARPKATAPAATKAGPKPKSGGQSASEFIRSQPTTTPAKTVVAAGAKLGLKFSDGLVYNVRSAGSKKPPTAAPARLQIPPIVIAEIAPS